MGTKKVKAKAKLDTSKPYGEVWGPVEDVVGARYSQGTKLFNAAGEEVHDFAENVDEDQLEFQEEVQEALKNGEEPPEAPAPEKLLQTENPQLPGLPPEKK